MFVIKKPFTIVEGFFVCAIERLRRTPRYD